MGLRPACRGRSAHDGCRAYAAEPPKLSNKVWVAGCLTPRFIACQSIHSLGCPPPDRGTELGGLLSSRSPPPPKIAPRWRVISRRMSTGLDGVGLDGAGGWTRALKGARGRTRDRCADGWPCARSRGSECPRTSAWDSDSESGALYTRRIANDAVTPMTTTEAEAGAPDGRAGAMECIPARWTNRAVLSFLARARPGTAAGMPHAEREQRTSAFCFSGSGRRPLWCTMHASGGPPTGTEPAERNCRQQSGDAECV